MHSDESSRIAGVLHDIRNLLTVICVNGELLAKSCRGQAKLMADDLSSAAGSLTQLVNDLDPEVETCTRDNCSTIASVLIQCQRMLGASNPSVEVSASWESDYQLGIPRVDLLRAVLNLATNAAEAAVSVSDVRPSVQLSVASNEQSVLISVADSGPGFQLPLSLASRTFFSTRETDRPRGLGLGIVRSIVGCYGGRIKENRVGGRTVVTMHLPKQLVTAHPIPSVASLDARLA